jgi:hypothetical protein
MHTLLIVEQCHDFSLGLPFGLTLSQFGHNVDIMERIAAAGCDPMEFGFGFWVREVVC